MLLAAQLHVVEKCSQRRIVLKFDSFSTIQAIESALKLGLELPQVILALTKQAHVLRTLISTSRSRS